MENEKTSLNIRKLKKQVKGIAKHQKSLWRLLELIKAEFGKRLRDKRKEKGLSQTKLGHMVGLTKQSISYYELGAKIPKASNLKRLADSLDVSADYLLGEKDD